MGKRMAKPNGLEGGIMVISIDDGYVEYLYHIKPKKCYSIYEMHKKICGVLGAKETEGKIRTIHTKTTKQNTWLCRLKNKIFGNY